MGVFLVVPNGDVLPGAIVVDGSMALRTASVRNALAGRTSWSRGIQPSEDWTS